MSRPKLVALLPMKANSVRVPGKNFREFNGKPLFQWALDTLLSIEEIDEIIINTDARNILDKFNVITNNRIKIRDRKPEICGDEISMNLILADDVENTNSDFYLMTHTTNPLISSNTIRSAISTFKNSYEQGTADSLFTVNKIQARFYYANGKPVNHDPDNLMPTQNLEPWFEENSNLYIFTANSFANTKARIGKKPIMFESPAIESVDIDTSEDWDFGIVASKYLKYKKME